MGTQHSFAFVVVLLVFVRITDGAEKYQPGPKLVDETTRWSNCAPTNQSIHDFQLQTLTGEFTDLSKYKGHVVLLINVATFCAFTQQYLDFNGLIEKNQQNGQKFTILGFPCNQFFLQEPGENHEIINGITSVRPGNGWKPHNDLHIFGKLEVNGNNQHPMYKFLKDSCPQTVDRLGFREEMMYNPIAVSDITWNFEKFLIDSNGHPRYRFHPTNWIHGRAVQKFIDELLAEQKGKI